MQIQSPNAAMHSNNQTSEPSYLTDLLYRILLDNMLEGCQIIGQDWRYIYLNPAAERHTRRPNQELLGNSYIEVWPGIEDTHVFATIKHCMEERIAARLENMFVYPNAEIGWFDLNIQPVPEGVLIMSVDITERKQAESAAMASQKRFQALIENAPDGIALLGIDGKLRQVTSSSERILGYSPRDVEGVDPASLTHPDDLPTLLELLNDLIRNPGNVIRTEYRVRHKDGSWHWLDSTISNLMAEPNVGAIVFNYRDVTERKELESLLLESEEKFRQIAETINEVFWMADPAISKMLYISPAYERIWGRTTQTLYENPRSFIEAIHPEDREHAVTTMSLQGKGMPFSHEYRITRPDGTMRWIWDRGFPMPDEKGRVSRYVGVAVDITERKHQEQILRQSQERLESILAGVADTHIVFDREWHYLYVNDAAVHAIGRPREQVLGRALWELYPDIVGTELASHYRRAMDERVQVVNDFHYLTLDTWWQNRFYPVPEGLAVFATDITDRKRAEKRSEKQLERLAALREVDRAIISNVDLHTILTTILNQISRELAVDAADVLMLNNANLYLEYTTGVGFHNRSVEKANVRLGQNIAGHVALERQPIQISNLKDPSNALQLRPQLEGENFVCYIGVPLVAKGSIKGVLEVYHRSPLNPDRDSMDFLNTLADQAAIAIETIGLFDNLQRSNMDLTLAYDGTIQGWSHAMDLRDKETEGHTLRVTAMTSELAGLFGIADKDLVNIRRGAMLHDIGKMGIPDSILLKPDALTDEEWVIMRKHPTFAFEMLSPIIYLNSAIDIPYCHHEKWDGSGYPRGLKGEQIPLSARIFAIVDVWDALTSDRPYRAAWSHEKAIDYIRSQAGSHFDPAVVDVCLNSGIFEGETQT